MKNVIVSALVLLVLLSSALVFSAEKKQANDNAKSYMYYCKKGNSGDKISREEFNILTLELQKRLKNLKAASSQISIGDAGFSYDICKMWETELDHFNENIETALKYVDAVRNKPDSMTLSLVLYVILIDIKTSAYDFSKIMQFEKTLKMTHYDLNFWCIAFQKAHLIPLAMMKDATARNN